MLLLDLLEKTKRNKTVLNGTLFSIFSFFNQGISFILLIIIAKFIQPDEYGNLSLFNTIVTICTYFMAFSSQGYLSISYFKKDKDEFGKDLTTSIFLGICTFIVFLFIIIVFRQYITTFFDFDFRILLLAIFIPFAIFFFDINQNIYRINENLKMYGVMSCGNAISNFILSLLLIVSFSLGWYGRVGANFICALIVGIISVFVIWNNGFINKNINWERIKFMALWGIPLIPHSCALWLRTGIDQYIIKYNYSIYDVGIFSFALNIGSIIITVGSAFNATNSVSIYKILSDNSKTSCEKMLELRNQSKTILMMIIIALLLVIIGISILVYYFLPNYLSAIPYFYILSIYGFIQCLYLLVCNYMFFYNKTKEIMYITFGTSLLHVFLSLFLTKHSLYFTAFIYVLIQIIIFILVWKYSRALIKKNVIEKEI